MVGWSERSPFKCLEQLVGVGTKFRRGRYMLNLASSPKGREIFMDHSDGLSADVNDSESHGDDAISYFINNMKKEQGRSIDIGL